MLKLNSDQFYKKLNRFYSTIKFYNKDMIYDYSYICNLEKAKKEDEYKEKDFSIAIFVRDRGSYLYDFKRDNISTFDLYKSNSKKVLIVCKTLDRNDIAVYTVKIFKI